MVEHEHVLDILAHVRALDVEVVQVFEGHYAHVAVELHHERDELLLANVVGHDTRVGLCQGEDLVVGVARDVVDADVRVLEKPLDGTLHVLVEAASLRVKDDVLAHDVEEAPVVLPLAPCQGVGLVPGGLPGREAVQPLELGFRCPEVVVVHVLLGLDDDIAEGLDRYGHEVGADPVERHSRSHVDA